MMTDHFSNRRCTNVVGCLDLKPVKAYEQKQELLLAVVWLLLPIRHWEEYKSMEPKTN